MYVSLTMQFGWTPEQVNRLDPHYLDELIARINAQKSHEKDQKKREERKRNRKGRKTRGIKLGRRR